MDIITYDSTLKADGKEYEKIVFWNRFLRNKTELILSLLPAVISIILASKGYTGAYHLVVYAIFIMYPVIIFTQFKQNIKYHLKNRDKSESAPCTITLMDSGILAEIPEYDIKNVYKWEEFTRVYDKLGYYMMFNKGTMIVMLRKADIPEDKAKDVRKYIRNHVDQNKCLIKF